MRLSTCRTIGRFAGSLRVCRTCGNEIIAIEFRSPKKGESELVAEAHFVLVSVRRDTLETVPLPDELIQKLKAYTKPFE